MHRWGQPNYLRNAAGPGRIVPIELGGDYTASDWDQSLMEFGLFLDGIGWDERCTTTEKVDGRQEDVCPPQRKKVALHVPPPRARQPTSPLERPDEFLPIPARSTKATSNHPFTPNPSPSQPTMYLAQFDLLAHIPALYTDMIIPDLVYADPPPLHVPPLDSHTGEGTVVTNTWIGPRGTTSPAHTDPY